MSLWRAGVPRAARLMGDKLVVALPGSLGSWPQAAALCQAVAPGSQLLALADGSALGTDLGAWLPGVVVSQVGSYVEAYKWQ